MKRIVLNYLIAVILSVSSVFASCNNDEVQLLDSFTSSNGVCVKYEYDNKNRFTKISEYDAVAKSTVTRTFTYNGNDLVKVVAEKDNDPYFASTTEFSKSGNKITMKEKKHLDDNVINYTIDLCNEGYPTKLETIFYVVTYHIQNGNILKFSYKNKDGETEITNFKYDNNKSPFYYCKTPKWYLFCNDDMFGVFGSQNNMTELSSMSEGRAEFKYEYDNAGFPIKITTIYDDGDETVTEFKYK